jgi:hypothetical protein
MSQTIQKIQQICNFKLHSESQQIGKRKKRSSQLIKKPSTSSIPSGKQGRNRMIKAERENHWWK